jgi:hypothetical protein
MIPFYPSLRIIHAQFFDRFETVRTIFRVDAGVNKLLEKQAEALHLFSITAKREAIHESNTNFAQTSALELLRIQPISAIWGITYNQPLFRNFSR